MTDRQDELFKAGSMSVFDVMIGNIGRIYKVRITSTWTGSNPEYFCDEIRMHDKNSGEVLVFQFNAGCRAIEKMAKSVVRCPPCDLARHRCT